MNVSKIIKDQRIKLNLTLKEVADYVNVSEGTVSRWESGEIKNMKRSRIAKLSQILQISPLDLMEIDNITTDKLTNHEKNVIVAYRSKPEMQPVIDKLLDVEEQQTIKIKYAARNGNSGEHELTKEEIEKFNELPDVTDI